MYLAGRHHHHQTTTKQKLATDGWTDRQTERFFKMLVDGLMDLQSVLKSCTICPLFVVI